MRTFDGDAPNRLFLFIEQFAFFVPGIAGILEDFTSFFSVVAVAERVGIFFVEELLFRAERENEAGLHGGGVV